MPEDVYELLSLGMRYWFVLLGLMIVWRAFAWLRKDRRAKHRRLRQLPDAGMIGEMVVLVGSDELPEGTVIPVPREGVLGFLRSCDVVVPVKGVAPHHVDFSFRDGTGLMIRPWRRCVCQVDAEELTHRHRAWPMLHGSRLFVGDAVLRLRVFEGIDASRRAVYVEDEPQEAVYQPEPEADQPETVQPMPWQQPGAYQPGQYQPAPWQTPGMYQSTPVNQNAQNPYQPVYQQPWQPYAPCEQQPGEPAPWQGAAYPQQPWQMQPETPEQGMPETELPGDEGVQESFAFDHARPRRRGRVKERGRMHEET